MQGDREKRIRHRAYEIWESAGRPEGQHDTHWAQACADIDEEDRKTAEGGVVENVLRRTTQAAAEVFGAGLNAVVDVVEETLAPKKSRVRKGKAADTGASSQKDRPETKPAAKPEAKSEAKSASRRAAEKTTPPAAKTGSHALAKTSDMDDVPDVLKPTRGKTAKMPEKETRKATVKGAGKGRGKTATGQSRDVIH